METAYTSLTAGQINALLENSGHRGRLVKRLTERSDILLSTLLIGNNLANLGASALMTALTIRLFGSTYIAAATGILTITVLIFCEVTPKHIAMMTNESLCLRSARVIIFLSWVFRPCIWFINAFSRLVTKLFTGRTEKVQTLETLLHHVKAAKHAGIVERYEHEMIRKVFRINDIPVEAIMTHRTDLFTLNEQTTAKNAFDRFLIARHSLAPLLRNDSEHVSGIVSFADVAKAFKDDPQIPIKNIASPVTLVPGTMKAHELFFKFKKEPIHFVVVLDEYGGLNGVVTREDVVEEVFGALYGEGRAHSVEPIVADGQGAWIIQGDADFYDLSDMLGLNLEHDNRTHTIGGYLLDKFGSIPEAGVDITLPEGRYVILETVKKRISSVRFNPSSSGNTQE